MTPRSLVRPLVSVVLEPLSKLLLLLPSPWSKVRATYLLWRCSACLLHLPGKKRFTYAFHLCGGTFTGTCSTDAGLVSMHLTARRSNTFGVSSKISWKMRSQKALCSQVASERVTRLQQVRAHLYRGVTHLRRLSTALKNCGTTKPPCIHFNTCFLDELRYPCLRIGR